MKNQHGPAHYATDNPMIIAAVAATLTATGRGGTLFLTPEADLDDLWLRFSAEAEVIDGPVTYVEGMPSMCHDNVAELAAVDLNLAWYFGYGLSDDGMWRIHSWGVTDDGRIVETTENRLAYVGIPVADHDFH